MSGTPRTELDGGSFVLFYDLASGEVTTRYKCCDRQCVCPVVPDDEVHAEELGISPRRHRLEHEVFHHLVGTHVYGEPSSPVVWREAHGASHAPDTADLIGNRDPSCWQEEEWLVTALTGWLHGRSHRDHGARQWLEEQGVRVELVLSRARLWLERLDPGGLPSEGA